MDRSRITGHAVARRAVVAPLIIGALFVALCGPMQQVRLRAISTPPLGPDQRAARVAAAPILVEGQASVPGAAQKPGTGEIVTLVAFAVTKTERGRVPSAITVEVAGGTLNGLT